MSAAFIGMVGCTTNQQDAALSGVSVVAGGMALDAVIQSGEFERSVLSVELKEAELAAVIGALDDYAVSRTVLGDITQTPEAALSLRGTIQDEHRRLVDAYSVILGVVQDNWQSYSAVDQSRLKRWQAQAERLEIQYNNFLAAVDSEISADVRYERIIEVLKIVSQLALMAV